MSSFGSGRVAAVDYIQPGERVLWSADAPTGLRFRAIDALLVPFSVAWCGFAVFWESAALAHGPLFFKLWGAGFVAVGLFLVVGRFFVDAALRARTSYAMTDRAAYIVRTGRLASVRRFAGSSLDAITYVPRPDGSGTIRFGQNDGQFGRVNPWMANTLSAFDGIRDAQRVYQMLVGLPRTV